MKIHPRSYMPLALVVTSLLSILWLWQVTLPMLDKQMQGLNNRRTELKQRQQAAVALVYQPLINRLQHPVPPTAAIIAALHKTSSALNLADATYNITQPQPYATNGLVTRHLGVTLPKADAAAALTLWQDLRQSLPCEVRLATFTADGPSARLELELIGGS